jgi:hypothetical protein
MYYSRCLDSFSKRNEAAGRRQPAPGRGSDNARPTSEGGLPMYKECKNIPTRTGARRGRSRYEGLSTAVPPLASANYEEADSNGATLTHEHVGTEIFVRAVAQHGEAARQVRRAASRTAAARPEQERAPEGADARPESVLEQQGGGGVR